MPRWPKSHYRRKRKLRRSRSRFFAALVLLALAAGGCATQKQRAREGHPGFRETGIASWYGPGFHGKRTANGEVYDMHGVTAAHKHLPFGTVVEVENLENGKRVQVRINDRGPFIRGRIIDLSKGAAAQIDLVRAGVAKVNLRIVRTGDEHRPASGAWRVQAGAFRNQALAQRQLERVAKLDDRAQLSSADGWHRVVIAPIASAKEARRIASMLKRRGVEAAVVRRP